MLKSEGVELGTPENLTDEARAKGQRRTATGRSPPMLSLHRWLRSFGLKTCRSQRLPSSLTRVATQPATALLGLPCRLSGCSIEHQPDWSLHGQPDVPAATEAA